MHLLKLNCPYSVGLQARIMGFIAASGGNILDVAQYTDPLLRWFFARITFTDGMVEDDFVRFEQEMRSLAESTNAKWNLRRSDRPVRTVILVSKQDHCLVDLLWRWRARELKIDISLVLSNHDDTRPLVEREGIHFEKIDFSSDKSNASEDLTSRLRAERAELIILARFMQVIPEPLCREFAGRIINIHHSFLPAFVGANPYRRAFERGVKLIGATCHYVTEELDQGPIIEQEVSRVEHYHEPDDLIRLGRDCERLALARGVRFHVEDRVLVHGSRAIVFRD
jgi:formyltetrahydrofolate deformylase